MRNYSDPAVCSSSGAEAAACATPANSPDRGACSSSSGPRGAAGYQILTMNTQFVTRLFPASPPSTRILPTPAAPLAAMPHRRAKLTQAPPSMRVGGRGVGGSVVVTQPPQEEIRLRLVDLGAKYSQDALRRERCVQRTSRARRFKKPYEVPWRLMTSHIPVPAVEVASPRRDPYSRDVSQSPAPNEESSVTLTPKPSPGSGKSRSAGNSTSASPEKPEHDLQLSYQLSRSMSLDELDFNRLRLAEAAARGLAEATNPSTALTGSTSLSGLEIDNMAQHLENLQVNE